jgi:hypothetical protein
VRVVLPEVVDRVAEELGRRNLVLRVEDLERLLVNGFVLGPGLEDLRRLRVLLLDPGERLLARDVFEPEERIVVWGCGADGGDS